MQPNENNSKIKVECYSGYKAYERPISFVLNEKKLMVDNIIDQWKGPDFEFYKVLADDGNRYLLKCSLNGDWMLEKIFKA